MNAPGTVRTPGGHRLRTVSRESRLVRRGIDAEAWLQKWRVDFVESGTSRECLS
jgi:hypothetical protein